jgi:hypothetical protein
MIRCGCDINICRILQSESCGLCYDRDDLREMNCGNNWSEKKIS